jgi:ABC transport permease subunit
LLAKVSAAAEEAMEWFGGLSLFAGQVARELFRWPFEFTELLKQIFEIGWRSAPLILLSGLAVSAVLSMHTRSTLERFGAESMIPTALAFALVTETGSLITGFLVSGRVGAGIGAELGGMRATEQIDALESLAVNSFKYLVVTRVVACVISLPLLRGTASASKHSALKCSIYFVTAPQITACFCQVGRLAPHANNGLPRPVTARFGRFACCRVE